jgi:hypothetical protein
MDALVFFKDIASAVDVTPTRLYGNKAFRLD